MTFNNNTPLIDRISGSKNPYRVYPKDRKDMTKDDKFSTVSDTVYKTFMLHPDNFDIVVDILSSLLDTNYDDLVKHFRFMNSEIPKDSVNDKASRTDLIGGIFDDDGILTHIVLFEMNRNPKRILLIKNIDYQLNLSRIYNRAGADTNLIPVTLYDINNFTFTGVNDTIVDTLPRDVNGLIHNNILQNVEISLPLILEKCYHDSENLTKAERWFGILGTTDMKLAKSLAKGNDKMEKAVNFFEDLAKDEEFLEQFDSYHYELLAEREEGRDEGIAIGRNDGISIGRDERNIEIAKKLLAKNHSLEEISDITGLSIEELKNIQSLN